MYMCVYIVHVFLFHISLDAWINVKNQFIIAMYFSVCKSSSTLLDLFCRNGSAHSILSMIFWCLWSTCRIFTVFFFTFLLSSLSAFQDASTWNVRKLLQFEIHFFPIFSALYLKWSIFLRFFLNVKQFKKNALWFKNIIRKRNL